MPSKQTARPWYTVRDDRDRPIAHCMHPIHAAEIADRTAGARITAGAYLLFKPNHNLLHPAEIARILQTRLDEAGPELITQAEAATRSGVSIKTIGSRLDRGALTPYYQDSPNPQKNRRLVDARELTPAPAQDPPADDDRKGSPDAQI